MVLGALGRLTSTAIRGLARNLFKGFYDRGISANRALDELKSLGLGYRRQEFLSDFRVGKGRYEQESRIKFVGLDKIPSEGILQSQYHGVADKYSLVFKATGYDPVTLEEGDRYFFYHRNTLTTRRGLESDALDWFNNRSDVYAFSPTSVSVVEGYINPAWE